MNINYIIQETPSFGKGLFALQDIFAGTQIWTYQLNHNVFEFNEQQCLAHLQGLPDLNAQQRFLDSTFGKEDKLCLIVDDGQYMNHAEPNECNCQTDLKTGHCYAIKDIPIGSQLFEDYTTFSHPPFLYDLLTKYNCEPTYYVLP